MTLDDKNIIYVGGDSFTAGEDLSDKLIPGYQEFSTREYKQILNADLHSNLQNWRNIRKKFYLQHEKVYDEHVENNHNTRWSSVLQSTLNKTVLNYSSAGGSSMFAIAYRAAFDINRLQNQGYKITDVILQLTNASRYTFFTNTDQEEYHNGESYLIRSINPASEMCMDLVAAISEHESYIHSVYRLFYEIYQADKMIESIIGKKPIFVDSIFFEPAEFLNRNLFKTINNFDGFIKDYSIELKDRLQLSMFKCINNDDEKVWTTSYHLNAEIHKRFAQRVAETYFN